MNIFLKMLTSVIQWFLITPEKGAETSIFLALGDVQTQGDYYYKSKPYRIKPWGLDEESAEQLWSLSCEIVNVPDIHRSEQKQHEVSATL